MSRLQALALLTKAWRASESLNELRLVPGLVCEGEWTNQPRPTREFLLHLLDRAAEGKWWSLPAFIRAIKEKHPDFQRPAGDYDSWFIKRLSGWNLPARLRKLGRGGGRFDPLSHHRTHVLAGIGGTGHTGGKRGYRCIPGQRETRGER